MNNSIFSPEIHPGTVLKQILAKREMSQSDLAFILGQQVQSINLIVSEKRGISPEMSKMLGKGLDLPADYFANLQKEYDLSCANEPDPAIAMRQQLAKYPLRDMIKRGWIEDTNVDELQQQLTSFFEVQSLDAVPYMTHSAKKTSYEEREIPPSQLAWLFRVRKIAMAMIAPPYSKRALSQAVEAMRNLTYRPEEARHVPRLLTECGVRFVIVESLPGAKIDGVCFWLNATAPVIGMSARFDRIDNFWFVIRHEIEHVLRNDGKEGGIFDSDLQVDSIENNDVLSEEERIANNAAMDFCVPKTKIDSFIMRKHPFYSERDVLAFSKLHNVHPGLVVGQLQRRIKRYDYLKKHQVKIRHHVLPGAMADGWGQTVPI